MEFVFCLKCKITPFFRVLILNFLKFLAKNLYTSLKYQLLTKFPTPHISFTHFPIMLITRSWKIPMKERRNNAQESNFARTN